MKKLKIVSMVILSLASVWIASRKSTSSPSSLTLSELVQRPICKASENDPPEFKLPYSSAEEDVIFYACEEHQRMVEYITDCIPNTSWIDTGCETSSYSHIESC